MVFSRSVFSNIVPDIVFFIFFRQPPLLIPSSLLRRSCHYPPHKRFYQEKMFFLSIKILFLVVVTYLQPHNLLCSWELEPPITRPIKKRKIQLIFYSLENTAPPKKSHPDGHSTPLTCQYRYPTGRLPSSFFHLPSSIFLLPSSFNKYKWLS